jgi:hypothetical protein
MQTVVETMKEKTILIILAILVIITIILLLIPEPSNPIIKYDKPIEKIGNDDKSIGTGGEPSIFLGVGGGTNLNGEFTGLQINETHIVTCDSTGCNSTLLSSENSTSSVREGGSGVGWNSNASYYISYNGTRAMTNTGNISYNISYSAGGGGNNVRRW